MLNSLIRELSYNVPFDVAVNWGGGDVMPVTFGPLLWISSRPIITPECFLGSGDLLPRRGVPIPEHPKGSTIPLEGKVSGLQSQGPCPRGRSWPSDHVERIDGVVRRSYVTFLEPCQLVSQEQVLGK